VKPVWLLVFTLSLGVAAIAFVYWRLPAKLISPEIVITSPIGGENWQPGEEHVISWKTKDIPAANKISITIRRIPPPPLQQEGQEFDPIIFTNLSNTGSVTWTISTMYPNGTYVLGISAYKSVPVTNPISSESKEFIITHPRLSSDLYPLYNKAQWNASGVESFLIGTTNYSGASISSLPLSAGMNPGSVITPFSNYYDQKLKALGWSIANDLAAGGHVGGQTGYRKNEKVIITGFRIDYQNRPKDAPSECPCTVTLSLFSTD
jgi:hypothetical protein